MATVLGDGFAFIHIPKTGGTWATHAMIEARIPLREPEVENPHDDYAAKGHAQLGDLPDADVFTFAFVRHPLDWWRSFWGHRMREGWIYPEHEIDSRAASEDFDDFIDQVVRNLPGWLGEFYERYVGPPAQPISFIGRFESLADDLEQALALAGVDYDTDALRRSPRRNEGDYETFPAEYRPDLRRRLERAERHAIKRFYGRTWTRRQKIAALGSARA